MEIWKDIKDYEGIYQVSNFGRVKNIKTEHVRILYKEKGYMRLVLYGNGKPKLCKVHRLVAQAFIPNPNNYRCINHKDEVRFNNKVDNLEWCTQKYNINYGDCIKKIREFNEKPILQKTKSGNEIKPYPSATQAYRETGINVSNICQCVSGKRKTAGGFIWEKGVEKQYDKLW